MAKITTKQTTVRNVKRAIAVLEVLNSNAVEKYESSVALEEKIGMRIHRIEYDVSQILMQFGTNGDCVSFGHSFLAVQPAGGFTRVSPGVIDQNRLTRLFAGGAIDTHFFKSPEIIRDFTDLPGGGILIHPANFYIWYYTHNAFTTGDYIYANVYYSMEDITQDAWDELWKTMFVTQAG